MLQQAQLPQLVFSVLNQPAAERAASLRARTEGREGGEGGREDMVRVTRNTVMLVRDISVS